MLLLLPSDILRYLTVKYLTDAERWFLGTLVCKRIRSTLIEYFYRPARLFEELAWDGHAHLILYLIIKRNWSVGPDATALMTASMPYEQYATLARGTPLATQEKRRMGPSSGVCT